MTREVFEFDKMRAPFSVGYGQFVLEESYVKGPLLGANLRGKVDFKTKRINIGGTYIPLQGLNGALGGIPVLGQIISGAQGEGIFGITFAVQGATSNPQVIVNPLSLVAPGNLRRDVPDDGRQSQGSGSRQPGAADARPGSRAFVVVGDGRRSGQKAEVEETRTGRSRRRRSSTTTP